LPVIFGQGSYSLSQRLGIGEKTATRLIYNLERSFPVAFAWIKSQAADSNNFATDIFGRRRKFQKDEMYKIKNFCIQSPSNMICLRKLVKLHEALSNRAKICFHIHDGYCISCNKKELKSVYDLSKKVLEEEDDLFPNLKLKTSCHYGENLNKLKNIEEAIK
jgi:DNA polymerase I-like protein with 3'-5' exonuclease and polymerase domains